MSDWRDFDEGRLGVSIGKLSDGESITVFIDESPYLKDEEIEQDDGSVDISESLRVPCIPVSVPDGYADMNGDEVNTVDEPDNLPDNPPQFDIINSSASFKKAMRECFPSGVEPVNAVVEITAHQPDPQNPYGRTFEVEESY